MIRHLGPQDVDIFRRIRLEALRLEPAAYASSVADWEALPDAEWSRRLAANVVLVDFHDGEPVALMGLMTQSAAKMAHRGTVIMVYVRADRRGKGHAEALLNALVAHGRARGLRQLELAVSAENPAAIGFYAREGFREFGRIEAGIVHEGREIEEVLMWRRIDAQSPA